MMSSISFIVMLLIMIIIPTIIYTFFFLINCPPNPFHFLRRNRLNDNSNNNNNARRSKIANDEDDEGDASSKDKNNNIELVVASSENLVKETECPVCLSVFVIGEELRQLKICKHLFHRSCIDKWLSTHCNCPVCRAFVRNHAKNMKEDQHSSNSNSNSNNNRVFASRNMDRDDFWQGLPDSAGLV